MKNRKAFVGFPICNYGCGQSNLQTNGTDCPFSYFIDQQRVGKVYSLCDSNQRWFEKQQARPKMTTISISYGGWTFKIKMWPFFVEWLIMNLPFSFDGTVCHRNSAFKHTTWSMTLSQSGDATLMQFDWHALHPQKNWRVHFRHLGWRRQRYLPPRLRGDMATLTTIALDPSFNLLLMSPRDRPARRDNTLGSQRQQHTPIYD